jgi:hypothetical protein
MDGKFSFADKNMKEKKNEVENRAKRRSLKFAPLKMKRLVNFYRQ